LNVPVDELMERFVRGDSSRTNEGSGLGLSIAQSLAVMQGAKFRIGVDGDLFKAELRFPVAE
jgi:signal transduction histidine kinase